MRNREEEQPQRTHVLRVYGAPEQLQRESLASYLSRRDWITPTQLQCVQYGHALNATNPPKGFTQQHDPIQIIPVPQLVHWLGIKSLCQCLRPQPSEDGSDCAAETITISQRGNPTDLHNTFRMLIMSQSCSSSNFLPPGFYCVVIWKFLVQSD